MGRENWPSKKNIILFAVCSIIGVILFLVPIPVGGGKSDLIISMMSDGIGAYIAPVLPMILAILFVIGTLAAIIYRFHPIKAVSESPLLKEPFTFTDTKLLTRILGTVFFVMAVFKVGPEFIWSPATGGTMSGLMISLAVWHLLSFYLFTFLMDFGCMDFVGTLIRKIMRPVFTLPGNSAIDCMASWIGNGPFGVIVTKLQYEEGYYTKRESAVVASCFSIVSITFCVIVAKTLGIVDSFFPYYLSVTISTLLCALILPRIRPLSKIADTYNPDAPNRFTKPETDEHLMRQAVENATDKAGEANFKHIMDRSNRTALDFFLAVYPTMMAIGTVLLIVSEYTPILHYMSIPFEYILSWLNIPEAVQAAPALLVGFVDMYLPAIMGSTIESPMTRFIIASVSISQLIYMTETGAIIVKNRPIFDLPVWKLFVLFILRTAISLPVAVIIAYLLF